LVSHTEKAGEREREREREQNKKMKRKKTVAEVVCEKKLMRKVVDSLKQLIRRVLKAKGLTTPTAKRLSFHTSFLFF
jgi:3-oxoacyl-[acyl-carrier-protein] synthase III